MQQTDLLRALLGAMFLLAGTDPCRAQIMQLRYTVDGDAADQRLGTGLSSPADLDHDGLPDFCVGTGAGCSSVGYVRAFRGLDGATLWSRTHVGAACDQFGRSVELVPDLDGDGMHDLAVGAPQANGNCGSAFLISTNGLNDIHVLNGSCSAPDDRFGSGVGRLGDITGDGVEDFVIAASSAEPIPGQYVGTIQAFDGSTGAPIWQADGTQSYDYARLKLTKDVNGDGVRDVTWHSSQHGFSPVGPGFIRLLDGATGAVLHEATGVNVDDHFGDQWTLIDDISGDGVYDMVVGVPRGDTFGVDAGELVVLSGVDAAVLYRVPVPAGNHHEFGGESGGSFCELPDLDLDGYPEFACGFLSAFDPAVGSSNETGLVGIYSGASGALLDSHVGEAPGDRFGAQVRLALGLAGQGTACLIVSATDAGGGKGRVYVFDLAGYCEGQSDTYCSPPSPNSVSAEGVTLSAVGCPSLGADQFGVAAQGLPPVVIGVLAVGQQQAQVPFGNGVLCVGGTVQRIGPVFADGQGNASIPIGLSGPLSIGAGVDPGDQRFLQLWYRDPVAPPAGFNFSDALAVTFAP